MPYARLWLVLIVLYFVTVASFFAQAVPIFEASDEAEHVIYSHIILTTGDLPVIQSREQMARQSDAVMRWNNQAHHAPLYYMLGAMVISWTERDDLADYLRPNPLIFLRDVQANNANKWLHPVGAPAGDTHVAVASLRLLSIVIGCGTLLLVYRGACLFFDDPARALLAVFIVASLPTFIVVHSSASNDPLTIFLYTAGIVWSLHVLKQRRITARDRLWISLIVAGIALTKLTGVSLLAVVYLSLVIGWRRGDWQLATVVKVGGATMLALVVLAGGWYLRNWTLYGDPLALSATASIWGREAPLTGAIIAENLTRIAKSFWFMVGYLHQPVFAPPIFYVYCAGLTALGVLGWGLRALRQRVTALGAIAWGACVVVVAILLYGTRSVDISYGRLLLPAVLAFVALLIAGLDELLRVFIPTQKRQQARAFGVALASSPLALMALLAPTLVIHPAYPTLHAVAAVPAQATPVNRTAGGLQVLAFDSHRPRVGDGETLPVDLYIRGNHPDNPALLVTAVDTYLAQRFGHLEIYPGMSATDTFDPDTIYRVSVNLPINAAPTSHPPRIVGVNVEWVDLARNRAIPFENGAPRVELNGAVFVDARYSAPTLATPIDARFGDAIALHSATIPARVGAGDALLLDFVWEALRPIDRDWRLTMQVFDSEGALVAQQDSQPYWYPARVWAVDTPHFDRREVPLPADLADGIYTVRVGWYRVTETGYPRLPVTQGIDVADLLVLPVRVMVE